jgi:cation transport regulator
MPYRSNDDLPVSIRNRLPPQPQDIFRAVFNSAWESCGESEPERREDIAHRVAWAAVKRRYVKRDGAWVERESDL